MLKRFSLVVASALALALLMPSVAIGQEERRFEAFGNFSYLFADVGGGDLGLADVGGIGFNGEFAFFLNDWLGLGVEVGHNTGDLDIPVIAIFPAPDIDFSQWTPFFNVSSPAIPPASPSHDLCVETASRRICGRVGPSRNRRLSRCTGRSYGRSGG